MAGQIKPCGDVNDDDETSGGESSPFTLHKTIIVQINGNSVTGTVTRQQVNSIESGTGISHKPLLLKVQALW